MHLVLSNSKNKIDPISFKKIIKISAKTSPLPNDQSEKEIQSILLEFFAMFIIHYAIRFLIIFLELISLISHSRIEEINQDIHLNG